MKSMIFASIVAAFVFSIAATAAVDATTDAKLLIVGRKEVPFLQRTYVNGLRSTVDGRSFCGGSLITARHILTAAHCGQGGDIQYASVGTHFLYSTADGVQVVVTRQTEHPNSCHSATRFDFLFIELAEKVTKYALLALSTTAPALKTIATIAGWG